MLSLPELRADCSALLDYCAGDVAATLEVLRCVYPLFNEQCPHPSTLSGMLAMSSAYLPTDRCCESQPSRYWLRLHYIC